jgi:hypothetical protein
MKSEVIAASSDKELREVIAEFCRRHPDATLLSVTQSESQSQNTVGREWTATVVIFFKE